MSRPDFRSKLCIDPQANATMFIACSIAKFFSRGEPSVELMVNRFGMSRATAFRWRKAWRTANGIPDILTPYKAASLKSKSRLRNRPRRRARLMLRSNIRGLALPFSNAARDV